MNDNKTESWRTINTLQRFNIYQEVILAGIYRLMGYTQVLYKVVIKYFYKKDKLNDLEFKLTYDRMFFYNDAVFAISGIFIGVLYLITWHLSGSYLGGLLCAFLFVANR